MTQPIIKKDKIDKEKLQEQQSYNVRIPPKYISDRCVHTVAWILLTVGLCILVTTFYLLILANIRTTDGDGQGDQKRDEEIFLEFNRSIIRAFDENILMDADTFEGCEEQLCNILCMKTANIFQAIHQSVLQSDCDSTSVILIENQAFPKSTLQNDWIILDHTVLELFITSSDITHIRSNAFNTLLFAKIFLLSLYKLNLKYVDGGALLGLYELKYLTIDSTIEKLDSAFFQPVQTTLTHIKLTANIKFQKDQYIFSTNIFPRLEYLDLSRNIFNVPLQRKMFRYMPILKNLIITNAKITSIDEDTFASLVGRLRLLNLSHNLLTTISSDLLTPILLDNPYTLVSVIGNNFRCDCDILPFVEIYQTYRSQFMDAVYCRAPLRLYGKLINNVDYTQEGCMLIETTTAAIDFNKNITTTTRSHPNTDSSFEDLSKDSDQTLNSSNEIDSREEDIVFQMRCLDLIESSSQNSDSSLSSQNSIVILPIQKGMGTTNTISESLSNGNGIGKEIQSHFTNDDREFMQFEPPSHEFELDLLPNHSVRVTINDFDPSKPVNIIWFSEQLESQILIHPGGDIDYDCMGYNNPSVIIKDLVQNTTYTFCLMPYNEHTVTPFNCLPLHVPKEVQHDENIWISTDQKQFTVGILCLIFMLSLFFGAVIAYFGIKAYPDLLEGSKNVLIVKKSDQTCYVSTISECEYLKNSSIKKKPLGSSLKKNTSKPPLPETPTSMPPSLYNMPAKSFERLYSSKSSSTCFEDPFTPTSLYAPPIPFAEDQYEMPKKFDKNQQYEVRCVPNNYGMSPGSPPPLPKRNSTISDTTISAVANRFSKAE